MTHSTSPGQGWSQTLYLQFADEAAARAVAAQLGVEFPADPSGDFGAGGTIPTGNHNYALVAPVVQWARAPGTDGAEDQGEAEPGYWAMLRLSLAWAGHDAAVAALGPYLRELENPSNVFA
ncbi:MAG: hypothetical protein KIT25_06455 [Enhydrobacter sp.]|nr:MAG: hypothetical protein KIT25_06455 [Enhydrobacter sp.]